MCLSTSHTDDRLQLTSDHADQSSKSFPQMNINFSIFSEPIILVEKTYFENKMYYLNL